MKIGIRLSIYDDIDNELAHEAAWIPEIADISEWRPTYDIICQALWDTVGELIRNAKTTHDHEHGKPV